MSSHPPGPDTPARGARLTDFLRLCLCSRWDPSALDAALALTRAPGWRWDGLAPFARQEGLAPMLYETVRDRSLVPPQVERSLRAAYIANAAQNAFLFGQLRDILQRFAAAGVPVMLLKGSALALSVYDTQVSRELSDIDLLVHEADLPRATAVLRSAGYAFDDGRPPCTENAYDNTVTFSKPGRRPAYVDLHWDLLRFYRQAAPGLAWLWETARPAALGDQPCLVMGLEASLLYLAAHLLKHGGRSLRWWYDLADIAGACGGQIAWERVVAGAQALAFIFPLQYVLPRLAAEWRVAVPEPVLARVAALTPSPAETRFFADRVAGRHRSGLGRWWAEVRLRSGWRSRLRFTWRQAFPPPHAMRRGYGAHGLLLPLYYPYRWLRGLRNVVTEALGRAPG